MTKLIRRALSLALALTLSLALGQTAFAGMGTAFPHAGGKSLHYTIATDGRSGYAISNDGWLYAWGRDHEPTPTRFLNDIVSVDGYEGCFYALKNDGTLFAWGLFTALRQRKLCQT